ncbi:porin family protein [Dysgonomonas massiliensis]|uniref:porin family protein n=1 Tax=Dysgonomonas massiliensis TaxID=2040292 RepID=UPI000C78F7D9|nr:porin family protein [Dysgonomonas massiliensis]
MIKRIISSLLFALLLVSASAQQKDFKPYWNVGVGFGPTFSSVDFARTNASTGNAIPTSMMTQFAGGVAVRYVTEKHLGFIAELNVSQMGWEQSFKEESLKNEGLAHSRKLTYIELPILTHIYFGDKIRFVVNLGPKIAYLASQKNELNDALANYLSSGKAPDKMVTHQYYNDVERKFDYGIMGGLGMEFQTKFGNFMLEGRYYFGLADMYRNSKSDYFSRSANRVFSAKLTYYVKLF